MEKGAGSTPAAPTTYHFKSINYEFNSKAAGACPATET